eukprot:scaffold76436_cov75-Phaeocystis_antarctica.AAC.4
MSVVSRVDVVGCDKWHGCGVTRWGRVATCAFAVSRVENVALLQLVARPTCSRCGCKPANDIRSKQLA